MRRAVLAYCACLRFPRVLAYGLVLAFAIELITVALRYGLRLQSTRDTGFFAYFTCGLRVHHGYIGLFLLLLGWCFPRGYRNLLWIVGIGLFVSDLVHHFLVLWPIEGSPQFDLVYPTR